MKIDILFLLLVFSLNSLAASSYKDLEWDGHSSGKVIPFEKMDVNKDIDLLIYALRNAYIGADYIDSKIFNKFIKQIESVKNRKFVDNVDLCKHLGSLFLELPDGHFSIWFPRHRCYLPKSNAASVGVNYDKSKKSIYSVHSFPKKNLELISIKRFASSSDVRWQGFSKALSKVSKAQNLIVDLRGNGGGDSTKGLELARKLVNSSIKHNRKEIIRKNTPEAWTIYRNNILRDKIWTKHSKETVTSLNNYINEIDEGRKKSLSSKKEFLIRKFKKPNVKKLGFSGNVYILIDKKCGSSCEHTLEALKFHPNAKSVGENTLGAIHYGQMGLLRLPSSGIYLNLATQYFKLFKKGYFEKVGYSPDIRVPAGKDALDYLFENIIK